MGTPVAGAAIMISPQYVIEVNEDGKL